MASPENSEEMYGLGRGEKWLETGTEELNKMKLTEADIVTPLLA